MLRGIKGRFHHIEYDLDWSVWELEAENEVVVELEYLLFCWGRFDEYLRSNPSSSE